MRSVNLFTYAKIYEINFVYIISEAVLKCEVFNFTFKNGRNDKTYKDKRSFITTNCNNYFSNLLHQVLWMLYIPIYCLYNSVFKFCFRISIPFFDIAI